ncbi:MAG: hypothetical protein N2712_00500 [Brevinematales bacterium]|nr:hypothetical protein [Brevinematales bacterium]
MKSITKFIYFVLEYLGVIEIIFQIKSSTILAGIFLNYIFGKKEILLTSGQLVDKNRMEFSIQRFIEKNLNIPVYLAKLILPSEFFVNKVITVPKSAISKIKNIVQSSVESMGIFDLSSLNYNYKIIGLHKQKDKTLLKILISAIKINIISEYVGYFKNLGINLTNIFSATVNNANIFTGKQSTGAHAIVLNKQDEILLAILSKNNILKLEIVEMLDRNIVENYIISFISDFIKERTLFLEKILFFYFEDEFIERIFDRVNILCVSGEILPENKWINDKFLYLDIICSARFPNNNINLLSLKDSNAIKFDVLLLRASIVLTLLSLIGMISIVITNTEVQRYKLIRMGIENGQRETLPEVERYIKVIEIKRKISEYETYISSFYSKFAKKEKYFSILYEVFRSIDTNSWLKDVEVFPKGIKVRGFSMDETSFFKTISNLSKTQRFSNIKILSISKDKNLRFEIEIEI